MPAAASPAQEPRIPSPRVGLCVLPTQGGKTFDCIQRIKKDLRAPACSEPAGRETGAGAQRATSLHIVFTHRTTENCTQFAARLGRGLAEEGLIPAENLLMLMSKAPGRGDFVHTSDFSLVERRLGDPKNAPRVIVCCAHWKRLEQFFSPGSGLVGRLVGGEEGSHAKDAVAEFAHIGRVHLHIDELHEFLQNKILVSPGGRGVGRGDEQKITLRS